MCSHQISNDYSFITESALMLFHPRHQRKDMMEEVHIKQFLHVVITVHIFPVLATFGQLLTIFRSNFNSIHYTGLHPYPAGLRLYLWSLLFGRNSMPVTQVLLLMYEALVKLFEKVFRFKFNSMI